MISLQFLTPRQEHESTGRVLCPFSPPVETFQQVRQTKVDPSNKVLWSIATTLQEFFAHLLRAVAMPSNILQSLPDESMLQSVIFKCAHGPFNDSGTRRAPHLVADFTDVSKEMADIIAKHRMQDNEKQPYELTAQKAKEKLAKADKALTTDSKKPRQLLPKR